MLIDFMQSQKQKFDTLAQKIVADPKQYLDFECIADFYQSSWLDEFPRGTTWTVSGLDDGAEHFDILIEFKQHYLFITVQDDIQVKHGVKL